MITQANERLIYILNSYCVCGCLRAHSIKCRLDQGFRICLWVTCAVFSWDDAREPDQPYTCFVSDANDRLCTLCAAGGKFVPGNQYNHVGWIIRTIHFLDQNIILRWNCGTFQIVHVERFHPRRRNTMFIVNSLASVKRKQHVWCGRYVNTKIVQLQFVSADDDDVQNSRLKQT